MSGAAIAPVMDQAVQGPAVETVTMTPAEWAQVPSNPRQRNTEERVKRAKHLLNPVEDHRVVKMAVLPDFARVKIDGHTRALFWQQHPELAPQSVLVVVFRCKDPAETLALYDACDNAAAVETVVDKVFGSFRELDYRPASALLRVGRIAGALRLAYSLETHRRDWVQDIHRLVRHWLPELSWLDGIGPSPVYFSTPILTAALLTLRKHDAVEAPTEDEPGFSAGNDSGRKTNRGGRPSLRAEKVRDFWERYNRNEGVKGGNQVDAIEALRHIVDEARRGHHLKASVQYVAARAVACVERHLDGKTYVMKASGSVAVKGNTNLANYFPAPDKPDKPPAPEKPPPDE